MFLPFDQQNLILRKMMGKKAFPVKPKHQNHVSKEEKVFIVHKHEKSGDYHENPSLSHLMDEL